MSDIWSGIGVDIAGTEGEWLYRVGADVRGPLAKQQVVEKLLRGEITPDTRVAREGGEFYPISRVAAFAEHLKQAQKVQANKAKARRLRGLIGMGLVALLVAGAGGYALYQDWERRKAEQSAAEAKAKKAEAAKEAAFAKVPRLKLVALVSLGTKDDVKIKSAPRRGSKGRRGGASARAKGAGAGKAKGGGGAADDNESFVSQCMLSQGDIFGTLRKHLGKLNVCVEDEKGRDSQGLLPPTLSLEFVVKPNGSVVEFSIDHRHFRRGPLNNCMIKAFRTIRFPQSKGANCPVTIPIKIGK